MRAKAQDLVERPADVRDARVPGATRGFQDRQWVVWKEAQWRVPVQASSPDFWVLHGGRS